MTRIVRAIMNSHVAGETDAEQQRHANHEGQAPCDKPLRDGKTGNAGSVGSSRHWQTLRLHIEKWALRPVSCWQVS
jgi:hypothetical protein